MTVTSTDAVPDAAAGRVSRRAVVRVVLWVVLILSSLLALWGTPRAASQDDLAVALKAGTVTAVAPSDGTRFGLEWELPVLERRAGDGDVVWADTSGRLHRTSLSYLASGIPGPDVPTSIDVPATITATASAAGRPGPTLDGRLGPSAWSIVPLAVLELAALALVLSCRQPRRVTRWGLAWVVGIPAGVGLGWWLWRESPFSPTMNRLPDPLPRRTGVLAGGVRRVGGVTAFFVAWGVSILVAIVLLLLIGLGASTNGLGDPVEPWTLVPLR